MELALFVILLFTAFGCGHFLACLIFPAGLRERSLFVLISIALGTVLFGVATLVLGLLGLLYPAAARAVLLVFLAAALLRFVRWRLWRLLSPGTGRLSVFSMCVLVLFLVFVLFNLVNALVPTVHHDTLTQYLVYPQVWIRDNGFTEIEFHFTDNLVFWGEALHVFCILVYDDTLARLFVVFGMGVLSAAIVYSLARKYLKMETALLGTLIFYGGYNIVHLGTSGRINLLMAFYEMLAISCFFSWLDAPPEGKSRWVVLSGLFAGFAAGTHVAGLKVVAVLFVLFALFSFTKRGEARRVTVFSLVMFLIAAAAAASPTYVKNLVQCGNPMFPFFREVFGGKAYTGIFSEDVYTRGQETPSVRDFFRVLWDITMKPWHMTRSMTICPLIVAFCPLIVLLRRIDRRIWSMLGVALLLYAAWFFSQRFARYALNYLFLLSIVAAYVAARLMESRRAFVKAVVVAAVFVSFGLEMERNIRWYHRDTDRLRCALGLLDRDEFLYKFSVGDPFHPNYRLCRYVNENTPPDSVVFGTSEEERYWLDRTYIPVRDRAGTDMYYQESPEELIRLLRENGVTHVLFSRRYIERINWHMRRTGVTEKDFFPPESLFSDDDFREKYLKKIIEDSGDILFVVQYPDYDDA